MKNREALAAALEKPENARHEDANALIEAAARERLAQLPETCGTCGGRGFYHDGDQVSCSSCHGRGTVYPAETVERIGRALALGLINIAKSVDFNGKWTREENDALTVAVLDALNTIPAPEEAK